MDNQIKNKKQYIYSYIFSFIIIVIVVLIFFYNKNQEPSKINNQVTNTDTGKLEEIEVNKMLDSGNYQEVIKIIEKKPEGQIERAEKMKLVYTYLSYGNYFYKEEENSKKSLDILNTLESDSEVLYYKGYANEIVKNYDEAMQYYNKGLEEKNLKNQFKSLIMNQIGHLYDLKGEFDKVFSYYDEAYKLDPSNSMALANLGRYYDRIGEKNKAYELLKNALDITSNNPLKAEISTGLSFLELEINGLKPDIDKSIDYARQAIDYYPEYFFGYVALAQGLFMKNNQDLYSDIEKNLDKSLELNPNSHNAYYLYVLHEIDKKNYEKASEYIRKTMEVANNDMILMDSDREKVKTSLMYDSIVIGTLKNFPNDEKSFMKLINLTGKLSNKKILNQVRRNDYGIFSLLKDNEEFQNLLKNY